MSVRLATAEDAEKIGEIGVASWRAAYKGLVSDQGLESLSALKIAERWREELTAREVQVFVIEEGGVVVGYTHICASRDGDKDAGKVGEITAVYLPPQHWRKGYGTRLMQRALRALQKQNFLEATLWVLEDNHQAKLFYEKLGFVHDGSRQSDTIRGTDLVKVRYTKDLA